MVAACAAALLARSELAVDRCDARRGSGHHAGCDDGLALVEESGLFLCERPRSCTYAKYKGEHLGFSPI